MRFPENNVLYRDNHLVLENEWKTKYMNFSQGESCYLHFNYTSL